jgi:hypothetical protein
MADERLRGGAGWKWRVSLGAKPLEDIGESQRKGSCRKQGEQGAHGRRDSRALEL